MISNKMLCGAFIIIAVGTGLTTLLLMPRVRKAPQSGLRTLAEKHHILIGVATEAVNSSDQKSALLSNFNLITPEIALKFGPLSPAQDVYDFSQADALVQFAMDNGLKVRGHTLVWTNQLPDWLTTRHWTRDELLSILHDHIKTVVGRYKGKIFAWDVVNEAINDTGSLSEDSFWVRNIGPEYIELAFQWAHEADPDALLFYNDFDNEGLNAKSEGVYQLAQDLLNKGMPLNGIGFQMHLRVNHPTDPAQIAANMKRLADLGLQVHITELDVRIKEPATQQILQTQADIYSSVLATCLDAPNCTAFVIWGLADHLSWIPYFYQGWGTATLLDEAFQPKPAYHALIDTFNQK